MIHFRYTAHAKLGGRVTGDLPARSRAEALETLARQDLIVSRLEATTVKPHAGVRIDRSPSRQWLGQLMRQLAVLAAADVPIDRAIHMIAGQQSKPRHGALVRQIADRITRGGALSDALADQALGLPGATIAIVKAGEGAGQNAQGLALAADYLERQNGLMDKVQSAMLYPAIVLVTAIGALGVISAVLVPALLPLFRDNGVEPPLALTVLAAVSSGLQHYGGPAAALIVGALIALRLAMRSPSCVVLRDRVKLALPLAGRLIREIDAIAFSRTLSALMSSGVPAPDALSLSATSLANAVLRREVQDIAVAVSAGTSISEALARLKWLDRSLAEFAAIGEMTGKLGPMLWNYATLMDTALNQRIERLTAVLGPAITLATGLIVGIVVVTIMQSILSVNELALR